jgi:hypothetical protein
VLLGAGERGDDNLERALALLLLALERQRCEPRGTRSRTRAVKSGVARIEVFSVVSTK